MILLLGEGGGEGVEQRMAGKGVGLGPTREFLELAPRMMLGPAPARDNLLP
jgi:hypothetical protein